MEAAAYEKLKRAIFPTTFAECEAGVDARLVPLLTDDERRQLADLVMGALDDNPRAIELAGLLKLKAAAEPLKRHLIPRCKTNQQRSLKVMAAAALYVIEGFPEAEDIILEIARTKGRRHLPEVPGMLAWLKPPTPKVAFFLLGEVERWCAEASPHQATEAMMALITLAHLFGPETPIGTQSLALMQGIHLTRQPYTEEIRGLSRLVREQFSS